MGEIEAFYARGLERDRLETGTGALEFARTTSLLQRLLPAAPALVADIGGGPGRYATWLAAHGYQVRLVDPVPLHIEQARAAAIDAQVGDARSLEFADESFDAVLLLGPLYHLPDRPDRIKALTEARRICRPGGVVVAAAISRFASTLDGLRAGYLADPAFAAVAASDLRDGRHQNPTGDPAYFTTAYFHRPEELRAECEEAGLNHERTVAIEGPAWLLKELDTWLGDPTRRETLLAALTHLEAEPSLLGASAHLLAIAICP
jgi:SAM-dependent methyltransferase